MPVPVWDCTELSLGEPLDTVLSDDIWKKFDLDDPLDVSHVHGYHGVSGAGDRTLTAMSMMMNGNGASSYEESASHGGAITLPEIYDKFSCGESREIRHHDCMWAGLCISKEHNRTLPAKKDNQVNGKKIAAGRSLLISSRTTNPGSQQISSSQQQQLHQQQQHQMQHQTHSHRRKDSLESDGDSARPDTPQSSEESETESENEDDDDEEIDASMTNATAANTARRRCVQSREIKHEIEDGPLVFRHDQISINEKLTECMSGDNTPKAAPVSEVTGQLVRKYHHHAVDRIKVECPSNGISSTNPQQQQQPEQQQQQQLGMIVVKKEPDNWNTLSDHCYHQPSSKKLEHLGVQTPSDSEEEIDVVTFEKPCRPAALPTYPSIADQQHFQLTVNSALKEKPVAAPRPRGRPPSSGTPKKRAAQSDQKSAKRARQRPYQRRSKVTKNCPPTPVASPIKTIAPSTSRSNSSSDDEPETEKRSLHNNMERQRRIELRNAFEELRVLVPEVEAKEKAPKVAILRQAAVYCDMLTEIGQVSVARVSEMKRRQERLRARLSQLRRSLAMTR